MKNWPTKPLGELLKVQNGFAFKSELFNDDGKGLPIIRIRDLARSFSETFYSGEHDLAYEVENGDFLIGMDGEFRCYRWQGGKALLNQRVCRLQNFSRDLDASYVFYGINEHLRKIEDSTAFVTVKHLSSKQISSIEMSVPPLAEQERIVKLLDEADELRKIRAQADNRTAALLPALFNEMIGDPVTNPNGFATPEFADVSNSIFKGAFDLKQAAYRNEGIPFIRISNVQLGTIDLTDAVFINDETAAQYKNCQLSPDDLVFCKVGTIDRIGKIPNTIPTCVISQNNVGVRLRREIVVPEYALAYLTSAYALSKIRAGSKKALQDKLVLSELRSLPFLLPPLPLQKEFAKRVTEIRELEATQSASRQRLESLFQSMLHRAFNGEI